MLHKKSKENRYYVTMEIEVLATSKNEAKEMGTGAIEHLLETFNDDDSLTGNYVVKAQPIY